MLYYIAYKIIIPFTIFSLNPKDEKKVPEPIIILF